MTVTPRGNDQPKSTRDDALAVVRRLRSAGHEAYFAGGCVRDMLLGLEPNDYDVATDAPPAKVRQLFPRTQAVGAAFGVILVRQGRSQVEVATFRTDLKYVDGRRPQGIVFTTAEEDAKRRDFTINGMFYDPIDEKVIDYVGGQDDLRHKWLRAIGNADERFAEDHLRMLRAVRFAARFGLEIKGETADAIAKHREELKRISPERIAEELRLMATPATRVRAWEDLWRLGLMPVLFRHLPEQADRITMPASPLFPELAPGENIPFGLALAGMALCYRAQARPAPETLLAAAEVKRTVNACRVAFKISNDESDLLAECTELGPLLNRDVPTVSTMKRFLAKPFAREARRMLEAIGRAWPAHAQRVTWLKEQFDRFLLTDFAPAPLITGDDLAAAGLQPGKVFKRVLDEAYDAQLEGRVTTKARALELALQIARG
jgi:poly(A) polymerase